MTCIVFWLGWAASNGGHVRIGVGRGELPVATLTHPSGATAKVYLHGAHVTSWRPSDGVERLFVSSASRYAAGKAIRGGIPVCFPQFSGRGPLPSHGFARTSSGWQVESTSTSGDDVNGEVCLVLSLSDSAETRAVWPHAFELRYTVTLRDASLSTDVQLRNADGEPLEFTAALHTYLATPRVGTAAVAGLVGLTYEDNAAGGATRTELAEEARAGPRPRPRPRPNSSPSPTPSPGPGPGSSPGPGPDSSPSPSPHPGPRCSCEARWTASTSMRLTRSASATTARAASSP